MEGRKKGRDTPRPIFKRNANAFSFNAIVDARLRRHEMTFLNISETVRVRASDCKKLPQGSPRLSLHFDRK